MTPLALGAAVLVERTETVRSRRLWITVTTYRGKIIISMPLHRINCVNLFYLVADICIGHYTDSPQGTVHQG